MTSAYAEGSIVIEAETTGPTEYVQFEPNGLPSEFWLHPRDGFDSGAAIEDLAEEYSLPDSESYLVRLIEVPADVKIRMGSVAAMHGRDGGGDLVELIEYDTIPDAWVTETKTIER